MTLNSIPLTNVGTWPYVTIRYHSFGDVGGLFVETAGAVTEDLHANGTYNYTGAEFADIGGDLHGKIFPTLNAGSTTAPWWPFCIKHGDDIGIVSPYPSSRSNEPGYLEVYTYDADLGMPSGSPTTVHFAAISDSYYSVLVSLAKIGTKYYAVHKVYKQGVVATTSQEYAFYGAIHNADGTIDSSWKIEDACSYTPAKVPSSYLANRGEGKQNGWTVRIKKDTTVWTTLIAQATSGICPTQYDTTLTVVNIGGSDYYEGTVVTFGLDADSPSTQFKFTAAGADTGWSDAYALGANGVLLNNGSTTVVAYVERTAYATGHIASVAFTDDDPQVDCVQAELNTASDFSGTVLWAYGPTKGCVQVSPPFSHTSSSAVLFAPNPVASASFRVRVCDVAGTYTAYSATITVALDATEEYVTNRIADFSWATAVAEPYDSNYTKVTLTQWTDETLQSASSPKMQVRNIANADTLFTCLHRLTKEVVDGVATDTDEDVLVALTSTGVVEKALTDSSSGGFTADSSMSGENGVAFLTYDFETGSVLYHPTFNAVTPTDLSATPTTPLWLATANLYGTKSALAAGYMGTLYYKPLTAAGSWQSIKDSEYVSMHYMSLDPWGKSIYFADDENGLILRYVVAGSKQSNSIWFQE